MSLSHCILGFLSYGSMSGYDLTKAFSSSVKFFWYAQASHIYLELNKLEQKRFVTCERIMQTEKPNKKNYTITEDGKKEFMQWLCSPDNDVSKKSKDAFLMKVFFSGANTPEKSTAMLRRFSEDLKKQIAEMSGIPQSIASYSELVQPHQVIYWQFAADFGYSYMRMSIDWAERCIAQLEGLK